MAAAAGADALCVSVHLDEDGALLRPIGVPDLAAHPERGRIAPYSEAVDIAKRHGVPIDKATRRLSYFPDSDTIEYEFEFVKHENSLKVVYSHFHVLAHDTTKIHWSESVAIR